MVLALLLVGAKSSAAFQASQHQRQSLWGHATSIQSRVHASTLTSEEETSTEIVVERDDDSEQQQQHGSRALQSILGDDMTPDAFFQNVWQQKPVLFTTCKVSNDENMGDGQWHDDKVRESPLEELTRQGWHVSIDLLERGNTQQQDSPELPLVMKNRQVQNREECFEKYGSTLLAAYLDGCSIVQNHADLISPWIAAFCQDVQQSFPYAYANTYLTPPNSQAMNPHADDREVFVVQLYGSKEWEVFREVPVDFPYPHEQVGKNGLAVPSHVLEGEPAISATLEPGDVLYIPRGYVHQARCTESPSFHVTIALATFDWTLAGMMNHATSNILTKVQDYRKGILPCDNRHDLQAQIDDAIKMLKEEVTAESMIRNLNARIDTHVQRAAPIRVRQIERARTSSNEHPEMAGRDEVVVGPEAAKKMTLKTTIRGATPDEKAQLHSTTQRLVVREESEKDAMGILSTLQSDSALACQVSELRALLPSSRSSLAMCDLSLLGLAKRAVELGEWAIVR